MPLVSAVVPTHNRPEMLAEALASIRAQTFTDYEIIVVSNGESPEICARALAVASFFEARFFTLSEGNVSKARNFGVAKAAGEWVAFLDDDDTWLPTKLERQIIEARRTGADMITCNYIRCFPGGREVSHRVRAPDGWSYVRALSHQKWGTLTSMVMVRRSVLDTVGGFDPSLRMTEDMDLWRRISWRHTIHQIDDVLARYRIGHASLSQNRWNAHTNDARHYIKIIRDTPPDLRSEIPSAATLLTRLFLRMVVPTWVRQPRKTFRAALSAVKP